MKPHDYTNLVLDGYMTVMSSHLPDYFYREIKKAEVTGISWEEFFDNLKGVITFLRNQFHELAAIRQGLIDIKIDNIGLPMLTLTGGRHTGHLHLYDVDFIKDSIYLGLEKFIKEKGTWPYENMDELIKDAILFNDIDKPLNETIRLNLVSYYEIYFSEFLSKVKEVDKANFTEFRTREVFKEYLKYEQSFKKSNASDELPEKKSSLKTTIGFSLKNPDKSYHLGDLYKTLTEIKVIDCSLADFRRVFEGKKIEKKILWRGSPYELNRLIHFLHNEKHETGFSILNHTSDHWSVTLKCFEGKTKSGKNFTKESIIKARPSPGLKGNIEKIRKKVNLLV